MKARDKRFCRLKRKLSVNALLNAKRRLRLSEKICSARPKQRQAPSSRMRKESF